MSTGGAFTHEPVMAAEVTEILSEVPPGIAVDATAGAGGHSARLLSSRSDLRLVAIDRDESAVAAARETLAGFSDRVRVVHSPFGDLDEVLPRILSGGWPGGRHGEASGDALATEGQAGAGGGITREVMDVTALLFDLGVSSPQLDRPERGFSYRFDAALDMRMDRTQGMSAADLVNTEDERVLTRILRDFGEERFARNIVRQIIRRRPLTTTGELVEAVRAAIPAPARRKGGHPAKRTFQALRIAVNDELGQLERGLDAGFAVLAPRGRMVVLSYQSLEDRIVKRRFADWATGGSHAPGLPTMQTARGGSARVLTRRPLRPSPDELARNPRAESARLRALEKLPPPAAPLPETTDEGTG